MGQAASAGLIADDDPFGDGLCDLLDIALVYVLISFVSTIAVLRVYATRSGET